MTRLTTNDIELIRFDLDRYDRYLESATGRTLLGIGASSSGIDNAGWLQDVAPTIKMAVVPIRSGLGVISGFSETVCGILRHLGFDAAVTGHADVAGFADAIAMGTQVIFAADDDRFVAFCPRQGKTVDNSRATARGFVAGLDLMAGGLDGKAVLVVGCGPVGRWSVEALMARRAQVCVVDREAEKARELARWAQGAFQTAITVFTDAEQALSTRSLVVDATNAADVIHTRHITARTYVAAPGMPFGIGTQAREKLAGRVLHDPLQIGVAAMACEAVAIICAQADGRHSTDPDGGVA